MKRLCIVAMFALCSCVVVNESYAGWFGPSNYDECILDNMKNVDSDAAARLVAQACRKKFPVNKNSNSIQELKEDVVNKIEGKASFDSKVTAIMEKKEWVPKDIEEFSGNIFNDNNDWHVTGLTIRIIDDDTEKYRDYDIAVTAENGANNVSPLSKGKFYLTVYGAVKNWSWNIVRARGYRK
ncbi:MAG: hypothetical protein AB7D27_10565 [Desulfomicrobium sp.]